MLALYVRLAWLSLFKYIFGVNDAKKFHPVELTVRVHVDFVGTHPFVN